MKQRISVSLPHLNKQVGDIIHFKGYGEAKILSREVGPSNTRYVLEVEGPLPKFEDMMTWSMEAKLMSDAKETFLDRCERTFGTKSFSAPSVARALDIPVSEAFAGLKELCHQDLVTPTFHVVDDQGSRRLGVQNCEVFDAQGSSITYDGQEIRIKDIDINFRINSKEPQIGDIIEVGGNICKVLNPPQEGQGRLMYPNGYSPHGWPTVSYTRVQGKTPFDFEPYQLVHNGRPGQHGNFGVVTGSRDCVYVPDSDDLGDPVTDWTMWHPVYTESGDIICTGPSGISETET